MRNFILTLAILTIATLTAQAQLPGIAYQNSFNFEAGTTSSTTTGVTDGGLVTMYPTGGGTYSIPTLGVINGGSGALEANSEVRVVLSDSTGTPNNPVVWIGLLTYVAPGQINMAVQAQYNNPFTVRVTLGSATTYCVVQKKTSGVWNNVSSATPVWFRWVKPSTPIFTGSGGASVLKADLYCSFDGAYLRHTNDPGNNIRVHTHGGVDYPTIIAFYLGDCDQSVPVPPNPGSNPATQVLVNGGNRNDLKQHTSPIPIGLGLWQQNIVVPAGVNSSTTFQFGLRRYFWDSSDFYGNIAVIQNWQ